LQQRTRWPLDARLVRMHEDAFSGASQHQLTLDDSGTLTLRCASGQPLLQGVLDACIGVCGEAWLLQLEHRAEMRFYGQGEKLTGLEKTGRRTQFWNCDVWADHPMPVIIDGTPDPLYAAIPYVLVQNGAHWIGVLVDHPGKVFMDTGSNWFFGGNDDQAAPASWWFGADHGVPAFYVIAGDSAASVTQRLQRLQGTTPLPPLWALGHHQCRWGYAGPRDLQALDQAFSAHEFPCDGLWLDIDYMDRYKVFTTSPEHFQNPTAELQALAEAGRRVVPILDPGVKVEAGDALAQSGLEAGVFCLTPEGRPYVGFVWPGRTWFPDFSLHQARNWWAERVQALREAGFAGFWLDMNDPSTGAADHSDMLFQRGAWPHWTYHNIYATGMAQASHAGLLQARPDERPFLLSRSAAAGSSRWTAVWTGDNWSNWQHLRNSIPCTLNLALSGLPFNGPDVPGFGGDATPALAVAWYKAGFLFPFLRNHAAAGTAPQEPWQFGAQALDVIRHVVRLRYKLLPYLYQLWLAQQRDGSPVLRPLFMHFDSRPGQMLDKLDDQFMVGPALMQAPVVHEGASRRDVILPGPGRWLDMGSGQFIDGGITITAEADGGSTPLYLLEGQLVPMQIGERLCQHNDLCDLELHVVLSAGCESQAVLDYAADDGLSQGWQRGERSRCRIRARRSTHTVHVQVDQVQTAWHALRWRLVCYDGVATAEIETPAGKVTQDLLPSRWRCSGAPLDVCIGAPFSV
jgi:alpha-glucosidase